MSISRFSLSVIIFVTVILMVNYKSGKGYKIFLGYNRNDSFLVHVSHLNVSFSCEVCCISIADATYLFCQRPYDSFSVKLINHEYNDGYRGFMIYIPYDSFSVPDSQLNIFDILNK